MAQRKSLDRRAVPLEVAAASEAALWAIQKPAAQAALDFAVAFLGLRMGASNDIALDVTATRRLMAIVRAVSIVESRHGTTGRNQPQRDPMQCGNPGDTWWKELNGQLGKGSRFIRGPALDNLWTNEIAAAAEATSAFPAAARLSGLAKPADGHKNAGFAPAHSYTWGILYLIHRINTAAGSASYACGDLSRERLIEGAVEYNGGGVSDYRARTIAALAEFGDPLAVFVAQPQRAQAELLSGVIEATRRTGLPISRMHATYRDFESLASVTIDFAQPGSELFPADLPAAADLYPGQKVPNASEVGICGAISKRIRRTDPEFAGLVSNGNSDIVFKDEERTGADRMMSARLKAGLDALAELVAAEWPGVRLRVTEAWDESDEHAGLSLHYEGRSADITTFPVDGNKLGRLGRLAVNAGLDWVCFEDSSHVHVSART